MALVIVDAVDTAGRRYVEVPVFPDDGLKRAFADYGPRACCECGALIRHAFDRYFQRNDRSDGEQSDRPESALMSLTYDYVCGACGDRAIAKGAS